MIVRIVCCLIIVFLVDMSIVASANTYRLEGTIDGLHPIVIELEEHADGLFAGRYAYKSTLQTKGDLDCSWLDLNPSYENPVSVWSIRDCKYSSVGTWYNVTFTDGKRLICKMRTEKGAVYDVVADVTASSMGRPSMTAYFKSHIGECATDFGLFFDPLIQQRLEELMGENKFNYMTYIYQTQGDIAYFKRMFWSSGFIAHQCCDPAAVWAYDVDNDSFYVWIRKNGKDYWWSETGNVPIKFRELVDSTI